MTEPVPCVNCGTFFVPRNRDQNFCPAPSCQRARKTRWEKTRRQTDAEYRKSRQLSQKKWQQNHPGYWTEYRDRHPEKTHRNRVLQKLRNRKRNNGSTGSPTEAHPPVLIAKVDARKSSSFLSSGMFWLVPEIANMDAVKIYFRTIKGVLA
jgi:hypothetical protein